MGISYTDDGMVHRLIPVRDLKNLPGYLLYASISFVGNSMKNSIA